MIQTANELKRGKIYWLIKRNKEGYDEVGFMREKHHDGFLVIGGLTGSHFGGHGESWKAKLEKLLLAGYIFDSIAKEKKIIPANWKAPRIGKKDKELIKLSAKVSREFQT